MQYYELSWTDFSNRLCQVRLGPLSNQSENILEFDVNPSESNRRLQVPLQNALHGSSTICDFTVQHGSLVETACRRCLLDLNQMSGFATQQG